MKKLILGMLVTLPLFSHASTITCLQKNTLVVIEVHHQDDDLYTADKVTLTLTKLNSAKDFSSDKSLEREFDIDDQSFSKGASYVSKGDTGKENFYFKKSVMGEDDGLHFVVALSSDDLKDNGKTFPSLIKMNLDLDKDCNFER